MTPSKQQLEAKAMELFLAAKAAGTLKDAPGLISMTSLSSGVMQSKSQRLTFRHYLPEARAWFAQRWKVQLTR